MKEEKIIVHHDELDECVKGLFENLTFSNTHATVLALRGNLGAGKTTFVKHLALLLGITEPLTSPTFVIQKNYALLNSEYPFDTLVHIDAYRLESGDELQKLSFDEVLKNPRNLVCIEWPEHVESILPENIHTLSFEVMGETVREITHTYGAEEN